MKARDVRRRDDADLLQEVRRLQDEIFHPRFHGASEEKVDRGLVRKNRRLIARIRTVVRARALGLEAPPAHEGK